MPATIFITLFLCHPYLQFVRSWVNTNKLKEDLLGLILLEGSLKHLYEGLLSAIQVFQVHQGYPHVQLFLLFPVNEPETHNESQLQWNTTWLEADP